MPLCFIRPDCKYPLLIQKVLLLLKNGIKSIFTIPICFETALLFISCSMLINYFCIAPSMKMDLTLHLKPDPCLDDYTKADLLTSLHHVQWG